MLLFPFSGPLGLWGSIFNWKQSIAAQPKARAHLPVSLMNRVCCFQTLDAVFLNDFGGYLAILMSKISMCIIIVETGQSFGILFILLCMDCWKTNSDVDACFYQQLNA